MIEMRISVGICWTNIYLFLGSQVLFCLFAWWVCSLLWPPNSRQAKRVTTKQTSGIIGGPGQGVVGVWW